MFCAEVQNLSHAGRNATLTIKTIAGKASLNLCVDIGSVPSPIQHPNSRNGSSRDRRREKRTKARCDAVAQAAKDMSPEEVDLLAKAEEDKTLAKAEEVESLAEAEALRATNNAREKRAHNVDKPSTEKASDDKTAENAKKNKEAIAKASKETVNLRKVSDKPQEPP